MIQLNTTEEYRKIYDSYVLSASKGVIIKYDSQLDRFFFQPISHNTDEDSVQQLSELMRKNLFFYCYGEEEVVSNYKNCNFLSLKHATNYAYKNRIPKRKAKSDGLPGEVLLDLLIQLFEKDAYKLAVRPILRQNDNSEIKGYDLTYFTLKEDKITLWLGQSKLGEKRYCRYGINKDLIEKYNGEYLTKQLFFVCEKPSPTTEEREKVVEIINKINRITLEEDDLIRAESLLRCFKENDISINIPCLLAYEKNEVYADVYSLQKRVEEQLEKMIKYYSKKEYNFKGFEPKVIFYIFPIKSIKKLRDKEEGFYNGLR